MHTYLHACMHACIQCATALSAVGGFMLLCACRAAMRHAILFSCFIYCKRGGGREGHTLPAEQWPDGTGLEVVPDTT